MNKSYEVEVYTYDPLHSGMGPMIFTEVKEVHSDTAVLSILFHNKSKWNFNMEVVHAWRIAEVCE